MMETLSSASPNSTSSGLVSHALSVVVAPPTTSSSSSSSTSSPPSPASPQSRKSSSSASSSPNSVPFVEAKESTGKKLEGKQSIDKENDKDGSLKSLELAADNNNDSKPGQKKKNDFESRAQALLLQANKPSPISSDTDEDSCNETGKDDDGKNESSGVNESTITIPLSAVTALTVETQFRLDTAIVSAANGPAVKKVASESPTPTPSSGSSNNRQMIPALSVVAAVKSSNKDSSTSAASDMAGSSCNALSSPDLASVINSQQSQKRPMNAFLIFCKRHRSVVREKNPLLENRSITKILGEWWAALDAEEKHIYTDLARQYKEAFMKANPHFKWYKTADLRPPPPQQQQQHAAVPSQASSANEVTQASSVSVAMPILTNANNGSMVESSLKAEAKNKNHTSLGENESNSSPASKVCSNNNSTPKPPKKRYLESMEAGDYAKNTSTNHSASSPQSWNSSNSAIANDGGKPTKMSGVLLLDDETASKVIEEKLFGNSISFNDKFKLNHQSSPKRLASARTAQASLALSSLEDASDDGSGGSGSETASDEEYADNANYLNLASNNKASTLPESIAATIAQTDNKSIIFPKSSKDVLCDERQEEQDKPLNLSADSKSHNTSLKSNNTVELQASNQQIIDIYIDKLLSDSKCFTDYSELSGGHNASNTSSTSGSMKIPISLQATTPLTNQTITSSSSSSSSSSVLNLANTLTSTTQQHQQHQQQPSKYFLVAKDFSLRPPSAVAASPNKRPLDAGKAKASVELEPVVPNKRSRLNGTVIDVNEVIQAAAAVNANAVSAAAVVAPPPLATSNSKYVTGSFDLEEHIRALPQLTQPAVVQLRNAHVADNKIGGAAVSAATNLLVVTSKSVAPNGLVPSSITSKHSNFVSTSLASTKSPLIELSTSSPGACDAATAAFPLRVMAAAAASSSASSSAGLTRMIQTPAGTSGPLFIKLAVPGGMMDGQSGPAISIATPLVTMVNRLPDGTTSTMSAVPSCGSIHTPATNLILAAAAAASANQSAASKPVDLSIGLAGVPKSQAAVCTLAPSSQHQLSTVPLVSLKSSNVVSAPSAGKSSAMLSTVISSQGSINQCDGLAALAEIALAQQARMT